MSTAKDQLPSREGDLPEGRTKSESAYALIRHWILIGRLEPGRRLDQEWLASTLQISRMPLRQALERLIAEGFVVSTPHRSAIVAPLSEAMLEDIYASRRALEGMLAEMGARKLTAADIGTLSALIESQEQAVEAGDVEAYVRHDRRFHSTLYRASGYEHSCGLIERLRDTSDRYIRFYASNNHGAHKSILEHWKILRAAEKGEAEKARELTERHIAEGYSVLVSIVRRHEQTFDESLSE